MSNARTIGPAALDSDFRSPEELGARLESEYSAHLAIMDQRLDDALREAGFDGAIIFDATPRGLTKLMPRLHRTAMTVGFVIVSAVPVTGRLSAHERHHIKQYSVLGPLFIPVYLGLAIPYGYKRHPMELSAMRAAGELPAEDRSA